MHQAILPAAVLAVLLLPLGPAGRAVAGEFTVAPETIVETKAVFGRVESRDTVPARSRITGTIADIRVEEGSHVDAGQLIATVVDDKLVLQRDAAEAEIRVLTSQLANAQTDLERAQQLLAKGATPQSRVDQAQTQVDVFTSQLAAAEARRAVVEQQLAEGKVLAPASGRVLSVPVTKGSVVMAGDEIVKVAGGGYFLRLSLPERHAGTIHEGGTVAVGARGLSPAGSDVSSPMRTGRIARVYPEISGGQVLADVEVDGLGDYFVGERTLVSIPIGQRQVISVPAAAITTRHGLDYVKVADGDAAIEVAVIAGENLDGGRIEILSGLLPGDRVILP
jgi:RND family efflux transporter MFP subunit